MINILLRFDVWKDLESNNTDEVSYGQCMHQAITPSHGKESCINLVGCICITYFKRVTNGAGTARLSWVNSGF